MAEATGHGGEGGGGRGERDGGGALGAALRRLVLLRPGEGPALLWAGVCFFFVLGAFFIIRPVREEMGLAGGIRNIRWLWLGTLAATLAVHPVYTFVLGKLPRRRSIPLVYRLLMAGLIGFAALIAWAPPEHMINVGRGFYIFMSVANVFAVAVFWSVMADRFGYEQSKRLFGAVAVGGTLGTIAGSAAATLLSRGVTIGGELVKPEAWVLLLIAAASIECAVFCVQRVRPRGGFGEAGAEAPGREPGPGVWEGLRLLARSPYLSLIALYVLGYTVTSAFLYVEMLRIAEASFEDAAERRAFFGQVSFWVNSATLAMQLFLTGRILRGVGVRGGLMVMPTVVVAGFAALLAHPTAGVLILFQILSRAIHFAVDKPTREVLYTVVGAEEKYKTKQFIDTFVYRAGDQVGIQAQALLAAAAVPAAAGAIGVGLVWGAVAAMLGAQHRRARILFDVPRPAPASCPACGYDLAGIPDDRCPACGCDTDAVAAAGSAPA